MEKTNTEKYNEIRTNLRERISEANKELLHLAHSVDDEATRVMYYMKINYLNAFLSNL